MKTGTFILFVVSAVLFLERHEGVAADAKESSDITLKVDVDPPIWKLDHGKSRQIKFVATLHNNTKEDKFVSLYFVPQVTLTKGAVSLSSGCNSDNAAPLGPADILKLEPDKMFVYTYYATLRSEDDHLLLTGRDENKSYWWDVKIHPGKYEATFTLISHVGTFIPNKLYNALKLKIWEGKVMSAPQVITISE